MPGRPTSPTPGPSKPRHLHSVKEQLIGPPGGRYVKFSNATPSSQPHRSYPESNAGTATVCYDPSKTALGKLFAKGNATGETLPTPKKMTDRVKAAKSRS